MSMRRGVALGVIAIVVISLLLMIVLSVAPTRGNKIALIPLNGSIAGTQQSGLFGSTGITPQLVRAYLNKAKQDTAVKAVVLYVDSPGGTVAASQEIAAMIRSFKQKTGKPVVVSMGDMAASGGYYISVYADKIVANPGTTTGSIGVAMEITNISGLLDKLGIDVRTITSPEGGYKDIGNLPDAEIQEMCDLLYDEFIAAIVEGRGLAESEVRLIATGQPYTGQQAKQLGLVDELGSLDDALYLAGNLAGIQTFQVDWYGTASTLDKLLGLLTKAEQLLQFRVTDEQLLLLKALEGWQAVPRYQANI